MDKTFQYYMDANPQVMDTINRQPTKGVPICWANVMQHSHLEQLTGMQAGAYAKNPVEVYLKAQKNLGVCLLDQYIPTNPLSMGECGYEEKTNTATTGAEKVVLDKMLINSPEAVVEHMEKFVFPQIKHEIAIFNEEKMRESILESELDIQRKLGENILKTGYGYIQFPYLAYYSYGYENYFMAYALYPEVMERHFSLQADLAVLRNRAAAKLYEQKLLPPMFRLDHDMADSRGTLVDIRSLDKLWMPHFARSLAPLAKCGVNLIWHCDGNLMEMLPRLIEAGVVGFQGFQYEDGMDYKKICNMKTRDGESLLIWAGVSVTRTLPFGTPGDVRNEIRFLVENGPKTGLFLGVSSSVAPGVPWENMQALADGFACAREGRSI